MWDKPKGLYSLFSCIYAVVIYTTLSHKTNFK